MNRGVFVVAGARHTLYGKNPVESIPLENHRKPSASSILLAETMPTLIQTFEPNVKEFSGFMRQYQSYRLTEVSPSQVALIAEISLD